MVIDLDQTFLFIVRDYAASFRFIGTESRGDVEAIYEFVDVSIDVLVKGAQKTFASFAALPNQFPIHAHNVQPSR